MQSCKTEGSLNSRTPPASHRVEAQGGPRTAAAVTDTSCSLPEAGCFELHCTEEQASPGVMPAELVSSCAGRLSAELYSTSAVLFIMPAMGFSCNYC